MKRRRTTDQKLPTWLLVVLLIVAAVIYFFDDDDKKIDAPMDGLYVHYIDIGQGDAALLQCDGEYMLIDGGDAGEADRLVEYLEEQGVDTLSYVICTHSHADHCGGLDKAIDAFGAERVFVSPYNSENRQFTQLLNSAENAGAEVEVPDMGIEYRLGEASFSFIGPVEEYDDQNNNSLVVKIEYGNKVFLFTGDMERTAENDLLDTGVSVKCDVLKVGHHGSSTSTSYRFLYEADPSIAVISCGEGNSYGHPHEETMSRLNDAEVTVYRTDLEGSIVLFCDGIDITKK